MMITSIRIKAWILGVILFLAGFAFPKKSFSAGFMEKAFFLMDIQHFKGPPFAGQDLTRVESLSQTFTVRCAHLNRIILPFHVQNFPGTGDLVFELYEQGDSLKPVYTTSIDVSKFPAPAPIGSYRQTGVLNHIWFPPLEDSRNKTYEWKLIPSQNGQQGIALYFTHWPDPKLQPLRIDGIEQENTYGSFYAYCQYRFNWGENFHTTWNRLLREKIFWSFYLILLAGLFVVLKKSAKGPS